jgi:hypothetical protein
VRENERMVNGLSKAQMFLLVIGAIAVISLTWYLTGIPEGIPQRENLTTIAGEYRSVWNPCTELLCPSLTVYAVLAEGVYYYLTVEGSWMLDRPWDGYMPEDGDYVKVTGYVSKKRDIEGSPFFEMEVVSLKPAPKPEYPETKQKVLAILNNLSYGWEAVYFPGALPITDDIPINDTISIYPNEVKNPCPYARCRFKGFAGEKRLALEAGSTVRFRGIIEDYHPAWISRGYKIEVLPASRFHARKEGLNVKKIWYAIITGMIIVPNVWRKIDLSAYAQPGKDRNLMERNVTTRYPGMCSVALAPVRMECA